jgi:hypothetical protein
MNYDKKVLGYILGDYFANVSRHSAPIDHFVFVYPAEAASANPSSSFLNRADR